MIRIQQVSHADAHAAIHDVRQRVFVQEQGIAAALERDALDPVSAHVLALDADGQPVGTGRLAPDGRIGRMAVLASHRSQGSARPCWRPWLKPGAGSAWLSCTCTPSCRPAISMPARASCRKARCSKRPASATSRRAAGRGQRDRQPRRSSGHHHRHRPPRPPPAVAAQPPAGPGLLDAPPVQAALRRFVTARHDKQLRVIVHDAAAIASAGAPLLALAQRLPSVIQFREVSDPVDRALASACLLNDAGDFYFRLIGHRLDGEAGIALPARSQPFEQQLQRVWDRSRDCSELRALGI